MLAKSNGLDLKTHSSIVSKTATNVFNNIVSDETIKKRYEDVITYASLLHDIGKLTTSFQRFLLGKIKSPSLKFRHNEIGWAFVSKYLSMDFPNREIILNIIYWHHGISNRLGKNTNNEILDSIDEQSINNMLVYLIDCVGDNNINDDIEYSDSIISPLYYPNSDSFKSLLPVLQLCRSTVITADRISSDLMLESEVSNTMVDNYFNLNNEIKITKTKFDDSPRFKLQYDIINQANGTTLIKAPAGFGKTIMGVMWSLKYNKKVIWVVPRNTIAESAYISVVEEFSNLNINPSIQLILSGEVKKTNNKNLKLYDADVIITNIDNFLAPNFKNNILDLSSLLFGCTVIFDEYHELITDAPLMSLFINIMRVRHRLTNSNTLLLSATQLDCEYLWDTLSNKTIILPNKDTHYPAVHDKKYLLKTTTESVWVKPNTNSLVVKNTITSSQNEKRNNEYSLLLHSDFIDSKKEEDFNSLISNYNKKSEVNPNKPNVVGTHIIQASLDISFNNLYEVVLSPQSTIQRIGRCDRFGNCIGQSIITISKELPNGRENSRSIKSEISIKNILYNRNLSDTWFDFISEYNNKEVTLNELYVIYNRFNKTCDKQIKSYIQNRYDESFRNLSNIYPIKFDSKKGKSKVLTAGSNKLRSVNTEVFYIVEHENGEDWVGPFTKQILNNFDIEFNESGDISRRMFKTMKKLRDNNDERFEFNDMLDNKKYTTLDTVRRFAIKSNTPYIVYDRVYNDELGIIKKNN